MSAQKSVLRSYSTCLTTHLKTISGGIWLPLFVSTGKLPRLTTLRIGAGTIVSNETAALINARCKLFTTVVLSRSDQTTFTSLLALVTKCDNITTISLYNTCYINSPSVVVAIAMNCPHLLSLNLGGGVNVDDAALVEVATRCSHLTSLNLSDCCDLTEPGVCAMIARLSNLTAINVTGIDCSSGTPTMLALAQCPKLQCVKGFDSDELDAASVIALALGCPFLQMLKIGFDCQVDDTCLIALARNCGSLVYVDFSGCVSVSDHGVQELLRCCPNLQCMDLMSPSCSRGISVAYSNICKANEKVRISFYREVNLSYDL
jgi:hypothetical protein